MTYDSMKKVYFRNHKFKSIAVSREVGTASRCSRFCSVPTPPPAPVPTPPPLPRFRPPGDLRVPLSAHIASDTARSTRRALVGGVMSVYVCVCLCVCLCVCEMPRSASVPRGRVAAVRCPHWTQGINRSRSPYARHIDDEQIEQIAYSRWSQYAHEDWPGVGHCHLSGATGKQGVVKCLEVTSDRYIESSGLIGAEMYRWNTVEKPKMLANVK